MQTFVPFMSYKECAECLDNKRLGKQRVENLTILRALIGASYRATESPEGVPAWSNHPAVKMWKWHEYALRLYNYEICSEWIKRGFKDTCFDKFESEYADWFLSHSEKEQEAIESFKFPFWWWLHDVHYSHKSALMAKDAEHYSKFFAAEPVINYIWPVR
jgi:hypothetical protein